MSRASLRRALRAQRKVWLALTAVAVALGFYGGTVLLAPSDAAVSATSPCVGAPAPSAWHHVVVVMFENTSQNSDGTVTGAPYVNSLVHGCGHSKVWNDANKMVDGSCDKIGTSCQSYNSKPSYAVLTNGQRATVTGITSDTYTAKTGVDNVFNQLRNAGRNGTSYVEGRASGDVCSGGGSSSGSYHDPMRYYSDLPNAWCNAHDLDLSQFDPAHLPDLSFVIPKNTSNWHDSSIATGDAWLQSHLAPLLNSPQYASGDTAVMFLTDEDSPAVNVLIAPSVTPGAVVTPSGNPVSHYAGLRTVEEMLGLPLLGDAPQAPSLLPIYGGTTSTSSSTSSTSSTSTSSTSTTTTTRPSNGACTTTTRLTGLVTDSTNRVHLPLNGQVDATGYIQLGQGGLLNGTRTGYVNTIYDGPGCWQNGVVWGTWPSTATWEDRHHTGAYTIKNSVGSSINGATAVAYGDSFRADLGSQGFTFADDRSYFGTDDCVEADENTGGTVARTICYSYVGYSARGGPATGATVTLDSNVFWLYDSPTVYSGTAPGSGPWFKTDANSPTFNLTNNVFRADQYPNHGDLKPPPKVGTCRGNHIVWNGAGQFPDAAAWLARCPDTTFGRS